MRYTIYEIVMLVFAYSFLAWLAETSVATVKEKNFKNRGFASGPFCFIYGLTAALLAIFFQELRKDALFLYLGSMTVATAVEWFAGKILERMGQKKWWDYSNKKWNIDGYICLQYSCLWGALGFLSVYFVNDWLVGLFHFFPELLGKIAVWGLAAIGFVDVAGSFISINNMEEKVPRLFSWNQSLAKWTYRLAAKLSIHIKGRFLHAYPSVGQTAKVWREPESGGVGVKDGSFVQLFWLFLIAAFLGDVIETIFCRMTAGVWMSRSSLVWGRFSVVWGLAIALITALLFKSKDRPARDILAIGFLLGGAYEYICSVFTEVWQGFLGL